MSDVDSGFMTFDPFDHGTATLSLRAPAPIDDELFERVMDQVMAGLCALSDIGVDASISSQRNQDIRIDLTLGDGWEESP